MSTLSTTFASRFTARRKRRGITQAELAATTGLAQSSISAYEDDTTNPTLEVIDRLATALGLPPLLLITDHPRLDLIEIVDLLLTHLPPLDLEQITNRLSLIQLETARSGHAVLTDLARPLSPTSRDCLLLPAIFSSDCRHLQPIEIATYVRLTAPQRAQIEQLISQFAQMGDEQMRLYLDQ